MFSVAKQLLSNFEYRTLTLVAYEKQFPSRHLPAQS